MSLFIIVHVIVKCITCTNYSPYFYFKKLLPIELFSSYQHCTEINNVSWFCTSILNVWHTRHLTMQSYANGNCKSVSYSSQGNSEVKPLEKEDIVRLMRLILEALELSIHLCNTFLSSFGPSRLMDILEQLLPTAYVVNTAYWPLYQTETGDSICICNIFSINCPHISRGLSWIDLDRPINEPVNFKEGSGNITLTDLHIIISKEVSKTLYINSAGCADYKYTKVYEIHLRFKTKNCWIDSVDDMEDSVVKCQLKFELVKPKQDFNAFCLWLTPHPLFNPLYGKHFPCLLDNVLSNIYPNSLIVTWDKCPKYTIKITEKFVAKDYEILSMKQVGLNGSQIPQNKTLSDK